MGAPANKSLDVALPSLARRCGIDFVDATAPVRRECIALDGVRLSYLDWGGVGDPIVFLHGGALTAHSWDLVCIGLRDAHRCIALDLRGHGDSDWSDDYRIETATADVAALVAVARRRALSSGRHVARRQYRRAFRRRASVTDGEPHAGRRRSRTSTSARRARCATSSRTRRTSTTSRRSSPRRCS